jgi:hypothetical protein
MAHFFSVIIIAAKKASSKPSIAFVGVLTCGLSRSARMTHRAQDRKANRAEKPLSWNASSNRRLAMTSAFFLEAMVPVNLWNDGRSSSAN